MNPLRIVNPLKATSPFHLIVNTVQSLECGHVIGPEGGRPPSTIVLLAPAPLMVTWRSILTFSWYVPAATLIVAQPASLTAA